MTEANIRLRVKLGGAEIEYEGAAEYSTNEIMPMLGKILELVESRAELQSSPIPLQLDHARVTTPNKNAVDQSYSTNTIATLLGAQSGSDLVIAASAYLGLVQNKEKMTRKEIFDEMKGASSFYRATVGSNLSAYLKGLVKADRLRLISTDVYGLSQKERKELERQLANSH
jgi:hypothetical protein